MRHRPDGVEEALRLAHEVEEAQLRVREKAAAIVAIEGSLAKEKVALTRLEAVLAAKLRIPAIVNTWTAHRERSVIGAKRRAPIGAKRRVFSGFPSGG